MISPREYKYEETTLIFDKTQPEHRNKESIAHGALIPYAANQSTSDNFMTNMSEMNDVMKVNELRSKKVY
jgi:hypothetical protein